MSPRLLPGELGPTSPRHAFFPTRQLASDSRLIPPTWLVAPNHKRHGSGGPPSLTAPARWVDARISAANMVKLPDRMRADGTQSPEHKDRTVPAAPAADFDTSPLEGCCTVTFGYPARTC